MNVVSPALNGTGTPSNPASGTTPVTSSLTTNTAAQRVHLVFLYHPYCDIRAASAIPAAFLKRLAILYGSPKTVLVGQIRYGLRSKADDGSADVLSQDVYLDDLLSPQSHLAIAPFTSIEEFSRRMQRSFDDGADVAPSYLTDTTSDVRFARKRVTWQNRLDAAFRSTAINDDEDDDDGDGAQDTSKRLATRACLCDGLVAAVEMFARSASSSPLARYLFHIVPSSCADLNMSDFDRPHSNLNAHHDSWNWSKAAEQLGKMGVWPSSIALPSVGVTPITPPILSTDADRVQKAIVERLPSTLPSFSDTPSILGAMFKQPAFSTCIQLCGLSDAAATAARASAGANVLPGVGRKRIRRSSAAAIKGERGQQVASSATDAATVDRPIPTDEALVASRNVTDADRQAIQKVLFLQQQQQMMMRNVKILSQQEDEKNAMSRSPTRSRLLDQFREQLASQHDTLRSHYTHLNAGAGGEGAEGAVANSVNATSGKSLPNLNESLQALISIDKAATDKGIHLGGPSSMQLLVQQHRLRQQQQQHQQQQQQQQQQQPELQSKVQDVSAASLGSFVANSVQSSGPAGLVSGNAPASAVASNAVAPPVLDVQAATAQQARRPGAPAVWAGAITWNMALPNKQRNAAATFVTALCAPNTKPEALMLPWPQRFTISEVQTVSLSAMQQYASTNTIPCIMFNPRPLPVTGPDGKASTPMSNQNNETMYMMLARMIDSKRGCAFMKLQGAANAPSEAGVVIVPTAQPGGGANRRLLGLVFRHAVPWHLFAPQQGAHPTTTSASSQAPSNNLPNATTNVIIPPGQAGINSTGLPQALFQQAQLQQQQQQQQQTPQQTPQQQQMLLSQVTQQQTPTNSVPTPLQPSLGNLGALSTSNLGQQLPAWATARVQGPGQPTSSSATMNVSDPTNAFTLSNMQSGNVDFSALAAQLNLAARSAQQGASQPTLATNANMFASGLWGGANNAASAMKVPQQQQQQAFGAPNNAGGQAPSATDLEALQRILGLGNP